MRVHIEGIRGGGGNSSLGVLLGQVTLLCHRVTEMKAGDRTVKSDYGEIHRAYSSLS